MSRPEFRETGAQIILQYTHWRLVAFVHTGESGWDFERDADWRGWYITEELRHAMNGALDRAFNGPGPLVPMTEEGMVTATSGAQAIIEQFLQTGEVIQ